MPYGRSNRRIFTHRRPIRRMTGSVSRKVMPRRDEAAPPAQARARARRGRPGLRITRRGWAGLAALLGLILLIVLAVSALHKPFISRISLQKGAVLTSMPYTLEVRFGRQPEAEGLSLAVDGEERVDGLELQGDTLRAELDLPDGEHRLELSYRGKVEKSVSFRVDATPPLLAIDGLEARDDGTTVVSGHCDGAVMLTVDGASLKMEKDGSFSFTANRYDHPLVTLAAADDVGNRSELAVSTNPPPKVKGIHASIWVAADRKLFQALVDLVMRTELNGIQIDIKDESGTVGYDSSVKLAEEVGSDLAKGGMNLGRVMDKCWYNDIYTIGRVVCFKDPKVTKKRPDLAVHDSRGGLWGNGNWLDPYSKEVWDYLLDISKEAAANGFNEIQFDYVRFPSDGDVTTCVFPHQDGRSKGEVIMQFMQYMRDNLKPLGIQVSADLFGLTASGQGEMGIGQDVTRIGQVMDYLSPMVYPSHYNKGEYDISVPEADPYHTVLMSLKDFNKKLEGTGCRLRPWLQDFSLKITYTPDMVRAQIQACYDAGVEEWLLWDPDCTFTEAALNPE
jgi:hypothetical protein